MIDGIGEALVVAAVIKDSETLRLPVRGGDRVDADAHGETADKFLVRGHFRVMRDGVGDGQVFVDTDGIRTVIEEGMKELIHLVFVVRLVMDQQVELITALGSRQFETP